MALFRGGGSQPGERLPASSRMSGDGARFRRERRSGGRGRATVLLAAIWLLGLVALVAVIEFERRIDETRQGQVVIAQMRNQQGSLLAIAFAPATAAATTAKGRLTTSSELSEAKRAITNSVARLARLGNSPAPARIAALDQRYFRFVDQLAVLMARGDSEQAAFAHGASQRPGGIEADMSAELARADRDYGADANHSKSVSLVGTVAAILFLLLAFSVAFEHSVRARRRSQREATTDNLTGLGNRRELFADMEAAVAALEGTRTITVGIFDLDGFKAYNDTFGHPAGDALLARFGKRLAAAVGDRGDAYRIGGDEFVVTSAADDPRQLMAAAQTALTEPGERFSIGCSVGSAVIHPGVTLEEALHTADQRLYTNKRVVYAERRSEVTDALLQVVAEQSKTLATHLGHVATLAKATAMALGLSAEQVTLTGLAGELHDIGKAAIPASILDKPGPLSPIERSFMQRHSLIGERIVAAAPTLEAIAPIVRSAHERADGTGYPDGLQLGQIPICARVIAVVDAYDAMTSNRPYRQAVSPGEALAELRRHAGTQFDPAVVEAFAAAATAEIEAATAA